MYRGIDPLEEHFAEPATAVIMQDREPYRKYLAEAERYSVRAGMILAGRSALDAQFGIPAGPDSFTLHLYSSSPEKDVIGLSDALYDVDKEGLGRYTRAVAWVPKKVYAISVNCRDIVTVTAIPTYKNVSMMKVLETAQASGVFSGERVQIVGRTIQLMEAYRDLTSVDRIDEWPAVLGRERMLRLLKDDAPAKQEIKRRPDEDISRFLEKVVRALACCSDSADEDPPAVVVGPATTGGLRLQLVCSARLNDVEKVIVDIAGPMDIQVVYGALNIPTDPRLTRFTIKARVRTSPGPGRMESVVDVFNLATYEMLPFTSIEDLVSLTGWSHALPPGTRVGSLPVLMRMRLVDYWTMDLLESVGGLHKDFVGKLKKDISDDHTKMGRALDRALGRGRPEDLRVVFPDKHIGRYLDPKIANSRDRQAMFNQMKIRPLKYYPAMRASERMSDGKNKACDCDVCEIISGVFD